VEISLDDINDWAQRAANLDDLTKQIGDALMDEKIGIAMELADQASPEADLLMRSMVRAGAAMPEFVPCGRRWWPAYTDSQFDRTPDSIRAAQALERAALLVLALENERGIVGGMGDVLADLSAQLILLINGSANSPDVVE
jgi:hypothetical protein